MHHLPRTCVCAAALSGLLLAAAERAFGFAEEPITFKDPATTEVWDEETSTMHSDLVYSMALAAGFPDKKAAKLAVWDQLVDSEKLGPGESVTYTNCLGSFQPAPSPADACPGGYGDGVQVWPMEHDPACATSRFGPYSPFFHFPRQTESELGALEEWGWGRAKSLPGYAAFAWGGARDTVLTAACRYVRAETVQTGIKAGSLEAFGTYLHSLGDSYSHADCLAALDSRQETNLWGTHTVNPITVPECYYVPSAPKNSDAHGQEFGPSSSGTDRSDAAVLHVYDELVKRSVQREGKYYPMSLDAVLKQMPGQPTLRSALFDFVHQWDFQQALNQGEYAANRRAYAEQIAAAVKAVRKQATRPVLSAVSPTSAAAKAGKNVKVTLTGSNFTKKCRAQANWSDIKTSYRSAGELQAVIPASMIAKGASVKISVYNTKGGGASSRKTVSFK